jgi:peptide/nickel transport system substrate-binding protein
LSSRSHVLFVALLAAALAPGCKKGPDAPKAGGAAAPPPAQWLSGELPAEVGQGTPVRGGTLTVRLASEPAMLNRLHDAGQDGWMVRAFFGSVFETLLTLDRDAQPAGRLKPLLAERYEISPDGLTSTFHLRPGVKFHDGSAFDSQDVRAVIEAVQNPSHPTVAMRAHVENLASVETPDPLTVVLRWKKPDHPGLRNFAVGFPMVPSEALQGDFDALAINRAPVGTGPFRFESWETGRAITLARNADYWGRPAWLDRVVFRIVKDEAVATQMLQRGELDLMTGVSPTVWRALERPSPDNAWAVSGFNRIRFPENAYDWIGWNEERPFLEDARVRRALGQLIPWDLIRTGIYLDLQPITTCPYYLYGPSCDPAVQPLRHDPGAAKALLAQAGWKAPPHFTFLVFAHSVNQGKLAQLLQEEFRKAGIELEIERAEWAVFLERLRKHDFDMVALAWSNLDVEDDLTAAFHSSQREGGKNYVSYVNAGVDALLDQSRRTFDDEARAALHRSIHRILFDDQVYAFLGARSSLDLVKKRVHGIRPAINWYDLSSIWVQPEGR